MIEAVGCAETRIRKLQGFRIENSLRMPVDDTAADRRNHSRTVAVAAEV